VARVTIDINDELIAQALRMRGIESTTAAVDFALQMLVGEPLSREAAVEMRGSGWSVAPAANATPDACDHPADP
jgi:Arc/MetJ family transcription regulator